MKLPMLDLMLKIEPLLYSKHKNDHYHFICNCAEEVLFGKTDKLIFEGYYQENHPRFYKWIMEVGTRLGKLNRGEKYNFRWGEAWACYVWDRGTYKEQKLKIFNEKLNQLKAERKRRSK